mmetsp:Transcript_54280/g.175518  ORF Transcript_54280/g.175518 Transcript_54280/m.175518 type:complete len:89 (+) Transcript_54280:690-956(+)
MVTVDPIVAYPKLEFLFLISYARHAELLGFMLQHKSACVIENAAMRTVKLVDRKCRPAEGGQTRDVFMLRTILGVLHDRAPRAAWRKP